MQAQSTLLLEDHKRQLNALKLTHEEQRNSDVSKLQEDFKLRLELALREQKTRMESDEQLSKQKQKY